jgi:type VI secretion system protein ImpH
MRDPVATQHRIEQAGAGMDFYQALRLLENAYPDQPRIGASLRPRDDAVRFGQDPSLGFEPGALAGVRPASGAMRPRVTVNFTGLLGANGPLPLHITEYVRERMRNHRDATLVAFLDVFHHRTVSLFYRARASADPAISLDRPDSDRFGHYVGSLFGIGTPALRGRDEIGDFAKLHFAGLMANARRPASGLVTILQAYFRAPVELEQFVGHWMPIPPEAQGRLGAHDRGNRLGASTVLGTRVWDRQHKFRLVIGPLDYTAYRRMLPGGASLRRLVDWVNGYAGLALDWDLRLVLRREEVPRLALGGRQLGWTTWLASGPAARDARQLLINPAHAG